MVQIGTPETLIYLRYKYDLYVLSDAYDKLQNVFYFTP